MAEYTFPLNGDLPNRRTVVHDFSGAYAQSGDGCGCRSGCCCPTVIQTPVGPQGEPGPAGPQGEPGADGVTPTFTIGTVTEGTTAQVTLTGTAPDYVLNFVLPTLPQVE